MTAETPSFFVIRINRVAYMISMELSYKELKKRDVVNIVDGRNFGSIIDLKLVFPEGVLSGIVVNDRKSGCLSRLFNRTKIYISEKNIIKIGGDVILVNVVCGETCTPSINLNKDSGKKCNPCSPCNPCSSPPKGEPSHIDLDDY